MTDVDGGEKKREMQGEKGGEEVARSPGCVAAMCRGALHHLCCDR